MADSTHDTEDPGVLTEDPGVLECARLRSQRPNRITVVLARAAKNSDNALSAAGNFETGALQHDCPIDQGHAAGAKSA